MDLYDDLPPTQEGNNNNNNIISKRRILRFIKDMYL